MYCVYCVYTPVCAGVFIWPLKAVSGLFHFSLAGTEDSAERSFPFLHAAKTKRSNGVQAKPGTEAGRKFHDLKHLFFFSPLPPPSFFLQALLLQGAISTFPASGLFVPRCFPAGVPSDNQRIDRTDNDPLGSVYLRILQYGRFHASALQDAEIETEQSIIFFFFFSHPRHFFTFKSSSQSPPLPERRDREGAPLISPPRFPSFTRTAVVLAGGFLKEVWKKHVFQSETRETEPL